MASNRIVVVIPIPTAADQWLCIVTMALVMVLVSVNGVNGVDSKINGLHGPLVAMYVVFYSGASDFN